MTAKILLLLPILGIVDCWATGETISNLRDATTVLQVRILPRCAFNIDEIRKVATEFLQLEAATHEIAVLSLYASRDIAAQETGVSCESGYPQWRSYYDRFPKRSLLAAEVISIGKDAVLRLRTDSIVREVIRGSDPTQIVVGGVKFDLTFVSGRVRSRFESCGSAGDIDPIVYLQTNAILTEEISKQATAALSARFKSKYIWAHFRNDQWFLCGQFPIVYPYSAWDRPPSEDAYYTLPDYACSIPCSGIPRCVGSTVRRGSQRIKGERRNVR
jgi:hypothetical protein